jgi:hypothetical protein
MAFNEFFVDFDMASNCTLTIRETMGTTTMTTMMAARNGHKWRRV